MISFIVFALNYPKKGFFFFSYSVKTGKEKDGRASFFFYSDFGT